MESRVWVGETMPIKSRRYQFLRQQDLYPRAEDNRGQRSEVRGQKSEDGYECQITNIE